MVTTSLRAPSGGTGGLRRFVRAGLALLAGTAAMLHATPARTQSPMTPSATTPNEFHWQGQVAAGRSIEIQGVIGDVRALPAEGGRVEVSATRKQGSKGDARDVELRVMEHAGGVTICAVYPSPAGSPPNECRPGGVGRLHVEKNDVQVDFTVRVPTGVAFVGRTVEGAVRTRALEGPVTAVTVDGEIRLELGGAAEAGRLVARSVGGSITVELGREAAARVEASTVGGEVATDFPLEVKSGLLGKRARGAIGAGGPELRLETIGGDIRLVRG